MVDTILIIIIIIMIITVHFMFDDDNDWTNEIVIFIFIFRIEIVINVENSFVCSHAMLSIIIILFPSLFSLMSHFKSANFLYFIFIVV